MSTQVQYRRGSGAQNDGFTGALGEMTVDTTAWTLRVHDGATVGGYTLASLTAAQTLTNKTLTSPSISAATFSGNSSGTANLTLTGTISATTLTGTLSTAAQTNITSVGTLGALTVTGNVTGGNLITAGLVSLASVTKTGSNGVGNIGSSTSVFNTVFAKATSAQYADVAEKYLADQSYQPGTVLEIGGENEVTATTTFASPRIAGIVSTAPAFIMNSSQCEPTSVEVALLGRVPCRVTGTIKKGDLLCSSTVPGCATAMPTDQYVPGAVIGKSLENYSGEEGTIEVLVGRL